MAGPFDITTRYLVETFPSHWLSLLSQPVAAPVQVIATDLATVSAEADRVIRVDAPVPWLLHLELQASYDLTLGRRLARYNLLLHVRYDLAVRSLLILLRPSADGPQRPLGACASRRSAIRPFRLPGLPTLGATRNWAPGWSVGHPTPGTACQC